MWQATGRLWKITPAAIVFCFLVGLFTTAHLCCAPAVEKRLTIPGSDEYPWCLSFSPDGRILAVSEGKSIGLWDPVSGNRLGVLRGFPATVNCLAFSSDSKTLANGTYPPENSTNNHAVEKGVVEIWDIATAQRRAHWPVPVKAPDFSVRAIAFSPDGTMLAVAYGSHFLSPKGNEIKVFKTRTGDEVALLKGHTDAISAVLWTPDSKTLVSASDTDRICFWDTATWRERLTVGQRVSARTLAMTADGKVLATGGGWDSSVRLWDVPTGTEIGVLRWSGKSFVDALAFSPNGALLASSERRIVRLWDVANKKQITYVKGHPNAITALGFSPDGKTLACNGPDDTIVLWDLSALVEVGGSQRHQP